MLSRCVTRTHENARSRGASLGVAVPTPIDAGRLANLQMEASLKYKSYDHRFVGGERGHDGKHGTQILPESLRWLWRPQEVKKDEAKQ